MTTDRAVDPDPSTAISFWLSGIRRRPAPALDEDLRADVAVVGAGFTGLWSALRLVETDPSLRVVVLEAQSVGHGARGRNGGRL
jgi:ribulose 1,5-bisphosphate synthetase/thiazole synthase